MFKSLLYFLLAAFVAGIKDQTMMKGTKDMMKMTMMKDTKDMMKMKGEKSCTPINGPLLALHPIFYDLLKETGLLKEVLNGFRGTIVVPEDSSITSLLQTLDLDIKDPEDMMIIKKVLKYHLVPDVTVFKGAVATRPLTLSTALSSDDATTLCVNSLNIADYTNTIRYSVGANFVVSPGARAGFVTEVEFCGPLVKIVVDNVLLPCDILGSMQ